MIHHSQNQTIESLPKKEEEVIITHYEMKRQTMKME